MIAYEAKAFHGDVPSGAVWLITDNSGDFRCLLNSSMKLSLFKRINLDQLEDKSFIKNNVGSL